jgi:hypothetical protein
MWLPCIIARVMSCIDGLYSFFYYATVIVVLFYCLPEDGRMRSRNMEGISLVCILLVLLSTCVHYTFTFMGKHLSSRRRVHTICGVHQDCYPVDSGRVQRSDREADNSAPSSAEFKGFMQLCVCFRERLCGVLRQAQGRRTRTAGKWLMFGTETRCLVRRCRGHVFELFLNYTSRCVSYYTEKEKQIAIENKNFL